MGSGGLSWEDCLPVIEAESRRYEAMGAQFGMERADLQQEASLAALQCLTNWREERGGRTAYVRRAVRNRFADVRRKALRERRVPYDASGSPQPQWVTSYEALMADQGPGPAIEVDYGRFESRWLLRAVQDGLSPEDWSFLLDALIEGAHLARGLAHGERRRLEARLARVRADAQRIVNCILHIEAKEVKAMVAPVPIPQAEALPECHTRGQEPQGYDPDDGVCWNCRDKFTCLPDAVDHGLVDEGVHVDREVEAVLAGNMTLRMAVERMRTRLTIMNRGADIPLDLQVSSPIETKTHTKPPPPPEPVAEPEPVRVSQEAAASAIAVPAKKKTVKKKPTRRAPAPDVSKLVDAQGRPTLKNGKPLPPIRPNTKKQMATALARVKIGQPCDLEVGMQLVRKTKDGEHVAVKIKPLGFELDGVLYSSLSTAIMYRLRKMQSGNAYFHLQNNQCTELWDADGHVLAGYST